MYCEIAAIASRTPEKARAVAAQLGIAKAYASYEDLLADPDFSQWQRARRLVLEGAIGELRTIQSFF